jgi:hypothetical protein
MRKRIEKTLRKKMVKSRQTCLILEDNSDCTSVLCRGTALEIGVLGQFFHPKSLSTCIISRQKKKQLEDQELKQSPFC